MGYGTCRGRKMNKLKIAVDLDGVVWDIMYTFVEIYNTLYNENMKREDINDWNFFPQERFEKVYPLTLPRIAEYPILDEYIPTYLYFLNKVHDVSIVTKEQNPIKIIEDKLITLDIYKGREYNELIRLDLSESKLDLPFNVYVDDYPGMAKKMNEFPGKVMLYYDQPWNEKNGYIDIGNVRRVKGWNDVLSFIRMIGIIRRM